MLNRIFLLVLTVTSAWARAADCVGDCGAMAVGRIDASAKEQAPEVALREASALARRGCKRAEDRESCELAGALEPMLAEFDGTSDVQVARKVLGARRCMAALRSGLMEIDAAARIASWCTTLFDGCEPGLMDTVGLASKLDRTAIVGAVCAEKVCPSDAVPATACTKDGDGFHVRKAADVLALLSVVIKRELPEQTATELAAALTTTRFPFFVDLPSPARALTSKELEDAAAELKPKLKAASIGEIGGALSSRLGVPHAAPEEELSSSWFAPKGKRCLELRFEFGGARPALAVRQATRKVCGPAPDAR